MALPQTPLLTVDVVIEMPGRGVVLIERKNPPPGWALPGGFVERGETCEAAAAREVREETGLELENLKLLGVYSDPARDRRFHTCSAVYTALGVGRPEAADDAAGVAVFPREAIPATLAFDHGRILADYFHGRLDARGTDPNRSFGIVMVHGRGPARRYLLLRKRGKELWEFPKGRAEAGESPRETARREILEETGVGQLALEPSFRAACAYERQPGSARGTKEVLFFLGQLPDGPPPEARLSREHDAAAWVTAGEARGRLARDAYRDVLRVVEAFLSGSGA